jgi:septal ring factor EnvC (AmiA/AmiB activator)
MQIKVTSAEVRARALAVLRRHKGRGRPNLSFIALALSGKQAGFDKVIGMIDAMVVTLEKEQADDESKKAYCDKEFDKSDDKKKSLELSIADSATAMDELEGSIAALAEEMKDLEAGIKDLDNSLAEATTLRKEENAAYKQLVSEDSMAKEVLQWAKNRLNKFYNPKLYKAPPAPELSAEDSIYSAMGGALPTEMPSGIAGTGIGAAASLVQVSAHSQHKRAPKTEESTGVIAMIDLLIADLDKELQESKVSESDAQADYETFMAGAKEKRAADSKALTEKGAAKAEAEEALQAETSKQGETKTALMETEEYIAALHGECDWILKFYDVRKEARDSEIDALGKAKAVLSGADYSFLQTGRRSTRRFLARHH